ncbi:MAG: MaoC family dehydratase [Propionibacteriaceae bacterium]|nr:MaoC family dehydratase [Propionibacteriaceae bacterium]
MSLEQTLGPAPQTVWYEDLEVGDRFVSTAGISVSEADIIDFARRFDPQPRHIDPVAAKDSLLAGLVASGWHTAAITMRLLLQVGLPIGDGLIGAGARLDWPTPTRPGDELFLELVVTSKRLSRGKPDRGVITVEYDTRNQRGELRQHTRLSLVALRRPDPSV